MKREIENRCRSSSSSTSSPARLRLGFSQTHVAMDSVKCSSNVVDAGCKLRNEMVFEAVITIGDRDGVDFDAVFEFIKERYEVPAKFRKRLKDKLKKLVTQSKLEMVGDRYKILDSTVTKAANPTQPLKPKGSIKSQELLPTTSLTSEEILKIIDDFLKVVAVAERIELEAKEAFQVADISTQLFNETTTPLHLAKEIFDLCSNGEKSVCNKKLYLVSNSI